MIFLPNITSESDARYLIAQYNKNPIRREPKNVGVIVDKQGAFAAKFRGETRAGEYSSSQLRSFNNPNAYRLWVDSWRDSISDKLSKEDLFDRIESGENYSLIEGGSVVNSGSDSAQQVCEYLYSVLVSDGGLAEALGETKTSEDSVALLNDVKKEFNRLELGKESPRVINPVIANQSITGKKQNYTFPFYQRREKEIFLITIVNFSRSRTITSRDYSAYMNIALRDVIESNKTSFQYQGEAVVRFSEIDDNVEAGLNFLENANFSITDWNSTKERRSFLRERESVALSL